MIDSYRERERGEILFYRGEMERDWGGRDRRVHRYGDSHNAMK